MPDLNPDLVVSGFFIIFAPCYVSAIILIMKKISIALCALLTAWGASAQGVSVRSTQTSHAGLRQFNTAGHQMTARKSSILKAAEGETPANVVEVPFTHTLVKGAAEVANYTVVDADGDGRTWKPGGMSTYTPCMVPNGAVEVANDWLITPPVHMPAGDYTVAFDLGYLGGTGISFDVKLGTAPSPEAMTSEIMPATTTAAKDMTTYEYTLSIPTEGYYYIGFHSTTTKASKSNVKLANLKVTSGASVVLDPPMPGTLTYELAPKGALTASLTYTAPTHTVGNVALTDPLAKVVLTSRWTVDTYTFENVAPGQVIEQEVPLYAGINNRFTAQCWMGEVPSELIEYKSIFAGPDTPLPPTNIRLTPSADFKSALLTWDPVGEVGENGGYVDPSKATYYIFDAFGNYYDPALASTTDTQITFDYSDAASQDFYAYQVTAGVDDNYSLSANSNVSAIGAPAALPFRESFAGGMYDGMWLSDTDGQGQNAGTITDDYFASLFDPTDPEAPSPVASQDGDGGFHLWLPYQTGAKYGLVSLRADLSGAQQPVLEFWYQGKGNVIDVLLGSDVSNLTVAHTIDLMANPTTDWTMARIALDDFKTAGGVCFEIRFTARDNSDEATWSIPLDNICVRDLASSALRLVTFALPASVEPGQTLTAKAHIENPNDLPAAPALAWTINGTPAHEENPEIAEHKFASSALTYTVPFNAPAELNIALALNGKTMAEGTVAVKRVDYPTVTDLSATLNGSSVDLTWSAPQLPVASPESVVEDFENEAYTPMSISGCGNWTVFDGDGAKTYNVFREQYNPYQTAPQAFQLFDNVVAQIPEQYAADAVAHSGQRFMIAISAASALNDNWLISPRLSGNAQTISFWAKSCMIVYPETFKVFYSTTSASPEAFTAEATVEGTTIDGNVPEEWTLYTVTLPEGATHFAIHHDAYDSLGLLVDDVTYEAASAIPTDLAIDCYHIFCNGQYVASAPASSTTHTHTPLQDNAEEGDYAFTYTVVPVYNHGVAHESNSALAAIKVTSLHQVGAPNAATIVDMSGRRVQRATTPGVYIITEANKATKVTKK